MMKRSFFALLCAFVCATSLARAAETPPSAIAVVNTAINAAQHIDGGPLAGIYTDDAIFVDEGPPYTWYGPKVGETWAAHVKEKFGALKMTNFTATGSKATTYHVSETGAYAVVPMVLDGMTSKGRFHENGAFTFTLRKVDGVWKISSQIWTVLP